MLAVVVLVPVVIIIWRKKHRKDEEIYRVLNTSLEVLAVESEYKSTEHLEEDK